MVDKSYLLSDEEMRNFIVNGYTIVKADLAPAFHEAIYQKTKSVFEKEGNPGNNLLPRIPEIQDVFDHPAVKGVLTSVLGPNYIMHSHRHPHHNVPKSSGQSFHKDSYWGYQKIRHHRPRWAMAFYYPQDVSLDNGPTEVLPGSQYYNTRSGDDAEQKLPICGEAGTVAIVHFDLWHRGMPNSTDKSRFMMKFQFVRMEEPKSPSWNSQDPQWSPAPSKSQMIWKHVWSWSHGKRSLKFKSDESVRVDELAAKLRSESELIRLDAAYALGSVGKAAVPNLIESLSHESELIRLSAAYALGAVGKPAVPNLVESLNHKLEAVKIGATFALAQMGKPAQDAIPSLTRSLIDESDPVRRNSAEALGIIGSAAKGASLELTKTLRDKHAVVRFNAALALAQIYRSADDNAANSKTNGDVSGLISALKDENRYVRSAAVEALHSLGTPEAKAALYHYLCTTRWCPSTTKESTF